MSSQPWYKLWFNEDYVKLYSYRGRKEAEQQVDFLIRAMNLKGTEHLLDLGCGLGRHSFVFGKRGYSVVGVDISDYLISCAQMELAQHPDLPVVFLKGDMYDLTGLGLFHVVINMFTSFGYFKDDQENVQLLHKVRKHLYTHGLFFLDYLHPTYVREHLVPEESREINGEMVKIKRRIEGDRIIKTISFPNRTYEEKVKLYDRITIESMLTGHGFRVLNVWNDYEGNPWRPDGSRQLFLAEAIH